MLVVDGIDDADEFEEVQYGMDSCGFSEDEKQTIFTLLAGILHLGPPNGHVT